MISEIFFQIWNMTEYVSILSCISDTSQPTIENDDLDEEEKKEVVEIVEDLMSIANKETLKKNLTNVVTENIRNKKRIKVLECNLAGKSENLAFHIDCDGAEGQEEVEGDRGQGLQAESGFVLGEKSDTAETSAASKGGSCFNCEGSHMMADCSLPRDEKRIAQKRAEMGKKLLHTPRYHVEEGQKFASLRPGLPSDELREALGLRRDELPKYIYLMRELGYPPGWLKEARVTQSGLSLYHTTVENKMDTGEEGEVEKEGGDKEMYDIDKLVTWPGFNSDLPSGFRDDTSWHRVRPLSSVQNITQLAQTLGAEKQTESYVRGDMHDVSTDKIDQLERLVPGEEEIEENETEVAPIVKTPAKERVTATDPGKDGEVCSDRFYTSILFRYSHRPVPLTIPVGSSVFKLWRQHDGAYRIREPS